MLTSVRGITVADVMCCDDGSSGTISDTYFSPNSVLGTIEPVTFSGMSSSWPLKMPRVISAPSLVDVVSRTSPTMTPRILTSARSGRLRPMFVVRRVTFS